MLGVVFFGGGDRYFCVSYGAISPVQNVYSRCVLGVSHSSFEPLYGFETYIFSVVGALKMPPKIEVLNSSVLSTIISSFRTQRT